MRCGDVVVSFPVLLPPSKVVHQLVRLHREGHKVIILGHSLGGGVAALLGVLLKDVRQTNLTFRGKRRFTFYYTKKSGKCHFRAEYYQYY